MHKALLAAALVALPAAAAAQSGAAKHPRIPEGYCSVSNMLVFERFLAKKPTADEFRTVYSCITLVMPRDVSTREYRGDKSRYFAKVDEHGRIIGGYFS